MEEKIKLRKVRCTKDPQIILFAYSFKDGFVSAKCIKCKQIYVAQIKDAELISLSPIAESIVTVDMQDLKK